MTTRGVASGPLASLLQRYQHAAAGAIYGTLVTSAVVAGESIAEVKVRDIAWSIAVTLPVYWLAHVYAAVLAEPSSDSGRPSWSNVSRSLRHESVILESAIPPLAMLVIFRAAKSAASTAVVAALWAAVIDLFLFGYAAASRKRLAALERLVYAVITALLGIAIIILKVALH